MDPLEQLFKALTAADAAGDTAEAQRVANEIRALRSSRAAGGAQPAAVPTPSSGPPGELQNLFTALTKADAAGDTQNATALANEIRRVRRVQSEGTGPFAPAIGTEGPAQQIQAPLPGTGSIADPLAQGITFGFGDELAGALGASANTIAGLFGGGATDLQLSPEGIPQRDAQGKLIRTKQSFGDVYRGIRDVARENVAGFAFENPKTALAAEIAGGLLTGGAGAAKVGALKGAQKLKKLATVGAAQGGLYGLGATTAEDVGGQLQAAGQGALLGGVLGAGAPAALRAVSTGAKALAGGVGTVAGKAYQSAVKTLKELGVPLTTGQQTGIRGVKSTETTLEGGLLGQPLTSVFRDQRQALQRRLFDLAGFANEDVASGVLSQEALERAGNKISKSYDAALKNKKVNLRTPEFLEELSGIETQQNQLLDFEKGRKVTQIVNRLVEQVDSGPLTGKEYQRIRSKLGKLQRSTAGRDGVLSDLYGSLKTSLDNAFELGAADQVEGQTGKSAIKKLNDQFAQFKQIEKLFNQTAGAKRGELPLASLVNNAIGAPGSKEWKDLLLAANMVLPDTLASSGTAQRLASFAPLAGFAAGDITGGLATAGGQFLGGLGLSKGAGAGALRGTQNVAAKLARGTGLLDRVVSPGGLLATPAALAPFAQEGQGQTFFDVNRQY